MSGPDAGASGSDHLAAFFPELAGVFDDLATLLIDDTEAVHHVAAAVEQVVFVIGDAFGHVAGIPAVPTVAPLGTGTERDGNTNAGAYCDRDPQFVVIHEGLLLPF